ncbi:FmdB family zinc ribbon protein [Plantactinospora sp. CA-290183]|uniref:FmdB family zinc ribbon protein n=1 Tax=Plantactinospora sp. CA-290183 TaxID=3240006 RepID=UPI003D8CB9A2
MPTYGYRCARDGTFDLVFPIGCAPAAAGCPVCAGEGARVFSAPLLAATPRPLVGALDRAARSAETPEVVSRIPGRRPARPRPTHPAHARLPRP